MRENVVSPAIIDVLAASIKKVKAGLHYAASGQYQDYPPGVLELGVALDAVDMIASDIHSACREWPDFWYDSGPTAMARKLRLAVIQNVYRQGFLSEEHAKELLSGPLMPGDDATVYDDSGWLQLKGLEVD